MRTNCRHVTFYISYNKILLRRNHAGAMLAGTSVPIWTVLSQMIRFIVSLDSTSIIARVMMAEI